MSWSLPHFGGVQTGSPEGPLHGISDWIFSGGRCVRTCLVRIARRLDWIHESYNVIWVLTYFGRTSVRESVRATPAPNGRG